MMIRICPRDEHMEMLKVEDHAFRETDPSLKKKI